MVEKLSYGVDFLLSNLVNADKKCSVANPSLGEAFLSSVDEMSKIACECSI